MKSKEKISYHTGRCNQT